MPSATQLAANQANAKLSTGPVTEAGRAISSRNNLRHGFRSQSVLLPGDDPAEYDALLAELSEHFSSSEAAQDATRASVVRDTQMDLTEQRFVREMADAEWRLRRVRQHMEIVLTCRINALAAEFPGTDLVALQGAAIESLGVDGGTSFSTWLRYETKYERQYDRAYQGWFRYQQETRRARDKDADIMMREAVFHPLPRPSAQAAARAAVVRGSNELASTVQDTAPAVPAPPLPTPRNAPCPCNSGEKFKRCCGKSAAPALSEAA